MGERTVGDVISELAGARVVDVNESELSLLCMLVDAVIDAPDFFPRAVDLALRDQDLSPRFKAAVDVVGTTLAKIKVSGTEDRRQALVARAKKLASKDPVVSRAIQWAVENRRAMNAA